MNSRYQIAPTNRISGIITDFRHGNAVDRGDVWTPQGMYRLGRCDSEHGTGKNLEPFMWISFKLPRRGGNTITDLPRIITCVPFSPNWDRRADGRWVLSLRGEIGVRDHYGELLDNDRRERGAFYWYVPILGPVKVWEGFSDCPEKRIKAVLYLLDDQEQVGSRKSSWELVDYSAVRDD